MAKAFFSHDCDARLNNKMLKLRATHGPAGYGIYWMLVERLRAEEGCCAEKNYTILSFDLHADEALIKSVVEDFGLFDISEDGKTFRCHGLDERMELAESRSRSGKKGAAARWSKDGKNGKPMANSCEANANKLNKTLATKKSSKSISPSLDSSPQGSESEGEEKEKILFEFFFEKNLASPEKEVELFLDYNNRDGRIWAQMSEERKDEAIKRWRQEPAQSPRFRKDFLSMWRNVYEVLRETGAPTEVRLDALSDTIAIATKGIYVRLTCSLRLKNYLESEEVLIKVRPHILGYVKLQKAQYLQYLIE